MIEVFKIVFRWMVVAGFLYGMVFKGEDPVTNIDVYRVGFFLALLWAVEKFY